MRRFDSILDSIKVQHNCFGPGKIITEDWKEATRVVPVMMHLYLLSTFVGLDGKIRQRRGALLMDPYSK